ncbi:TetR/AcrR family transcriptional regulator [Pendulispora albinea]|uniref:TetR/AcrR family transcriptional regulator n=1 Tax=Pendulispora albinea TaxID=2741071 RepID=A0ABZ2M6F9_9BACT
MPAPIMSKEDVVALLYETFRKNGYDSASLAELSKETGLGKSSLYHYFPGGKEEMALTVLDLVDASMQKDLIEPLLDDANDVSPQVKLERALETLEGVYARGRKGCILGVLSAASSRHRFQKRLKRSFHAWIEAFARLALEAGLAKETAHARAEDAVLRIEGALVVSAGLNDPKPFHRTMADLRRHFLE